jgi:hypothetical protein
VKVLRLCPLVLLTKAGWKQGRALGSEEGAVIGRELCEYTVEKRVSDLLFSEHFLT